MKEVVNFLNENNSGFLSTIDGTQARVRPWGFMFEEAGKLYFCTANTKNVYKQLTANPNVEFCVSSPKYEWLRISGKVVFTDDLGIKERILASNPLVKSLYQTPDNPVFEAFYINDATAVLSDFSGNPPKTYSL